MSNSSDEQVHTPPIPQHDLDEGRVLLKDGTSALIRRARESDRDQVLNLLEEVSESSRFQRFFGASQSNKKMVESLIQVGDPREELTLFVITGPPEDRRIIGVGNYSRIDDDPPAAEPAFLVHDDYQGKGIGTLLLERLALIAVRNGIEAFEAYVLPDNRKMKDVFESSGFSVTKQGEKGSYIVRFDVTPNEMMVHKSEVRDRIATVASLKPFFTPKGVAVVGASREPDTIGHRILVGLIRGSYNGPVYPVNPAADHVGSIKAYESVAAIPGPVDLAIMAVPAESVDEVVDQCHDQGIKAIIVVTAGFSEVGEEGRNRQLELRDRVYGHGMRMIGPNCLGLINTDPEIRLNASFAPFFPLDGSVAMASQSGALGLAILDYATGRDIGFSYFVSIGNKADISSNDLIQYWEDDARTEVILLYLESFGNPRRFSRLSRRIGRKKPIVVIKGGRSDAGRKAASSHTAALASPDIAVEALFQQAGIIPVDSLESMFNVGDMLVNQPLPEGPGVAIVTNSGGPGILSADVCESMGLQLVELEQETQGQLRDILPDTASLKNPIDMIASAGPEQYETVLEIVMRDENVDSVIVIFTPLELDPSEEIAWAIRSGVERGRSNEEPEKPVVGVFIEREDEQTQLYAGDQRIPTFRFPEDAARTLGKVYQYSKWRRQYEERPTRQKSFGNFDVDHARDLCQARAQTDEGWLGFDDTENLLSSVGISTAEATLTRNPDEAVEVAEDLEYPVVLKMSSRTLIHKTEWDGIELDLENENEVREAYDGIHERLEDVDKLDELEGIVVQEQLDKGVELMAGMTEDEVFGPLLTFGLGGIHVEILGDITVRLTPLTEQDAREMLDDIKGTKLLDGYRGHPPADREALCNLLLRISRLVDNVPEIKEIDFNPLKAFSPDKGYKILDTRIRVAPTS